MCASQPSENDLIDQIFDYVVSDPDLTESCVLTIAERMKRLTVTEMKVSKELLEDRLERVCSSNAVDLLMVAITDDQGSIEYKKFKNHLKGKRNEEYTYLLERLKRIRLHRGNVDFPVRMQTTPETKDPLHTTSFEQFGRGRK